MDRRLRVETLSHDEETDMLDALIARTGKTIKDDADVWREFREHVRRRHHFIHRAEQPSVEDAKKSVLACKRFSNRLMALLEEQVDKLAEERERERERERAEIRREAFNEWAKRELGSGEPDT